MGSRRAPQSGKGRQRIKPAPLKHTVDPPAVGVGLDGGEAVVVGVAGPEAGGGGCRELRGGCRRCLCRTRGTGA